MDVSEFLWVATPVAWLACAQRHVDLLLLDHAHCEKKAAQSALHFILRYPEFHELVYRASRFAREELRHFEQVYKIMRDRNIPLRYLTPSRYASGLQSHRGGAEEDKLLDSLIIASIIEARSCERFGALLPYLDDRLAQFYRGLLASEARHFLTYLDLAKQLNHSAFEQRVSFFLEVEARLITEPDDQFRFHSGAPSAVLLAKDGVALTQRVE